MLAREKSFMTSLKVNSSNLIKKIFFTSILFYSINGFSEEKEILEIIEKNWNETQTISGKFSQTINNKNSISGDFYFQKPYKSNFTYDSELENIITTKFFINITDQEGFLIERYPIINQPIYKMLSKKINFRKIFEVLSINKTDYGVIVKLIPKNKSSSFGSQINLTFSNNDYSLKNWEIIDAFGQSTFLEFTMIRKNISIDPKIFQIKIKKIDLIKKSKQYEYR